MAEINLRQKFPSMTPAKAPPLYRINGCGLGMYGSREHDAQTGTYVSTLCVSLLFIPILGLRAYRVARSARGWYFLGREPLSKLARAWNLLLVLALGGMIGVWGYVAHTSSPAYRAARQMAEARELVDQGQLGRAAAIYQRLAAAGADQARNATTELGELLDKPCKQAPLSECAGVFSAAAQIARRDGAVPPADVVQKGLALVGERADSDPRGGLGVLDAIRPLTLDTRPIDARRLPLSRKWATAEPGNLDAACELASLLEQQNQLDEAKKLLLPFKTRLGDGEGARVLGTILARQGDYDGAYALLWPYVKNRLDKLHAAEKASESTLRELWDRQIQLLNEKKGPPEFYTKYHIASKDEQDAMVQAYVHGQIKNDPQYTAAQEALRQETGVVPVALELGIVMLQRAQAQSNPGLRKTQLEAAEQVFLAIGGFAGQTDEYRLSLGQVCYWLGKQAEGRKLFDDFLGSKGRDCMSLLEVAVRLRQLGAVPEARTTAEEAYTKANKDQQRYDAAGFRSLCNKDSDDEIAWLNKADTANPTTKARLANALGDKAILEGRDSESAAQYHIAIDAYGAMPRTCTTLNETARAWYSIFRITDDRQALDRCFDYFQQAVDLSPSDPILLTNAAGTLVEAALGDVIGSDIDLRDLRQTGGFPLLGYLCQDQAGRDAVARRVKDHPGIARALSYYQKLMVVSPKSTLAYDAAFQIHQYTRNDAALEALAQRIRAAEFDTADALTRMKEFLGGLKDEQAKIEVAAGLKRAEGAAARVRAKGGRTLAVALCQQVDALMVQDMVQGGIDPQKVVALAEEAAHACPSTSVSATLEAAHLFRAAKDLCRSDSAFASFQGKYTRSLGVSYILAAAANTGPLQQNVLKNADVQTALLLLREQIKLFPEDPTAYAWVLLKNAAPAEADNVADAIKKNPRSLLEQSISMGLHPASAAETLDASWVLQIHGKDVEARAALRKVADLGIPVPEQP